MSKISQVWAEFKTWWEGTVIGKEIDAAAEAAKTELESISAADIQTIAAATATGILNGLSGGTASAIAAGINAAEAAFKAAASDVSSTTVSTFASTLHNSIVVQQAAGAVTSAAS